MRICDCFMNVGLCECGSVIEPEPPKEPKKRVKVDEMERKINFSNTIRRKVVLEFENTLEELGLGGNRSMVLEEIMLDFILKSKKEKWGRIVDDNNKINRKFDIK